MILGLDLSLTSTGWARLHRSHSDAPAWGRVAQLPAAKACMGERLDIIRTWVSNQHPELVVIERGVVMRVDSDASMKLGMVRGVVEHLLWEMGIPVAEAPPGTVKTLATGKGNAKKEDVKASARARLGYTGESDDEADALWLADLGARLLGWDRPALPQTHLRALTKVKLPAGLAAA